MGHPEQPTSLPDASQALHEQVRNVDITDDAFDTMFEPMNKEAERIKTAVGAEHKTDVLKGTKLHLDDMKKTIEEKKKARQERTNETSAELEKLGAHVDEARAQLEKKLVAQPPQTPSAQPGEAIPLAQLQDAGVDIPTPEELQKKGGMRAMLGSIGETAVKALSSSAITVLGALKTMRDWFMGDQSGKKTDEQRLLDVAIVALERFSESDDAQIANLQQFVGNQFDPPLTVVAGKGDKQAWKSLLGNETVKKKIAEKNKETTELDRWPADRAEQKAMRAELRKEAIEEYMTETAIPKYQRKAGAGLPASLAENEQAQITLGGIVGIKEKNTGTLRYTKPTITRTVTVTTPAETPSKKKA